ncbi:MAG: hypothetical protein AB7D00_02850 [Rhodospirillaceae bacterium]
MQQDDVSAPRRETARRKFLSALAETGSVRAAAAASGRARSVWLGLRGRDLAFAAAWDQALEAYVELLEAEADRRAVGGEEEPIFYGGKQVGVRAKPSDSLLMFRLKALRPGRYRNGADETAEALTVTVRDFSAGGGDA